MRKVWIDKKKKSNGKGVYFRVRWYDAAGKPKSKNEKTKALAEQCRLRIEHDLNHANRTDAPEIAWDTLRELFVSYKRDVQQKSTNYLKAIDQALDRFEEACGPAQNTKFNHDLICDFVRSLHERDGEPATVNSRIKHLRVFVNWCVKNHKMDAAEIRWNELLMKEVREPPIILTQEQLNQLLHAAYECHGWTWMIRIVLAVCTGMRSEDIEALQVADIDLQNGVIRRGLNRKSGRMKDRPFASAALPALQTYLATLPPDQTDLFADPFDPRKWIRIKEKAKTPEGFKFHNLRACFASDVLMAGFSTSVAQDMLDHSTPWLTHFIYSNLNPVYRAAADAVPIGQAILNSGAPIDEAQMIEVRNWAVDETVRKLAQLTGTSLETLWSALTGIGVRLPSRPAAATRSDPSGDSGSAPLLDQAA